uniref:Uncharacterized protein n=1 Tax=Oryza glumipatula TaxID=40148 RepID=A0A0E0AW44_9ORYZ
MLPRSQSIFHLGEEGGVVHCHRGGNHLVAASMGMGGAGGHYGSGTRGGGRRARERERLVVGLQIIVHSQHHHGRHAHAHAASVVLKQMAAAAAAGRPERRGLARHHSPHRAAAPVRGRPRKTLAVA